MQLKKLFAIGLAFTMMTTLLVGCSSKNDNAGKDSASDKVYTIGMITDTGGVNDESFNQSTWEGLQKAEKKFGSDKVKVKYLESTKDADYVPNIETFVEEDLDLIIGVGYKIAGAIEEAAKNYPEKEFATDTDKFSLFHGLCLLYLYCNLLKTGMQHQFFLLELYLLHLSGRHNRTFPVHNLIIIKVYADIAVFINIPHTETHDLGFLHAVR